MSLARLRIGRLFDIVTSLVLVSAALLVIYRNLHDPRVARRQSVPIPADPIAVSGLPTKGAASARFAMVIYSDFECPFCKRFAQEVLPVLEKKYVADGRLVIAYKHFPLPSHANAAQAAMNADCAGQQGRFWPTHDRLFQSDLTDEQQLSSIGASLPNPAQFEDCLLRPETKEHIDRLSADGKALGIRSTPTFMLGRSLPGGRVQVTQTIVGALSFDEFSREIDRLIEGRGWSDWVPFI